MGVNYMHLRLWTVRVAFRGRGRIPCVCSLLAWYCARCRCGWGCLVTKAVKVRGVTTTGGIYILSAPKSQRSAPHRFRMLLDSTSVTPILKAVFSSVIRSCNANTLVVLYLCIWASPSVAPAVSALLDFQGNTPIARTSRVQDLGVYSHKTLNTVMFLYILSVYFFIGSSRRASCYIITITDIRQPLYI
jgi:hypothetical protein